MAGRNKEHIMEVHLEDARPNETSITQQGSTTSGKYHSYSIIGNKYDCEKVCAVDA